MLKENYKQEVVKKDVSDLLCSKAIGGIPWSTLYYKLRDPSWDRGTFFSKLTTEDGRTLMDQLKKELKHEEGKTPIKRDEVMDAMHAQSKKEKIKHTKAIYTVSADFQMIKRSTNDEVGIMGLALIDR